MLYICLFVFLVFFKRKDREVIIYCLNTFFHFQKVVSDVTAAHDRELLFQANENLVVKIQANYRGYQARKAYKARLDFMKRQLPLIIKIQVRGGISS